MNEIIVKTLGDEFDIQSNLFQHFIYHVLEEKLKTHIQLQYINNEFTLTIYSVPNEEIALLINDVARVTKPTSIVYMYKYEPKVPGSSSIQQVSRGCAVNSDCSLNVGLAPIHNTCPIRGNYIKLDGYTAIKTGIKKQNDPSQLLDIVIKYNLKYIFNYIAENYKHLFTNQVLRKIIKTGNYTWFKKSLSLVRVEQLEADTLLKAIEENQYDMVHDLLKLYCPVSTECVRLICTKNSQTALTWVNLYGNYSSVDFHKVIEGTNNLECIKSLSHHVDSEFILNKAIHTNDEELFAAFIQSATNLNDVLTKCIKYERLAMIKLVPFDNDVFNHILEESVKMEKQDIIEYILLFDNEIFPETWKNLNNLESLCNLDMLVRIFNKCPDKPRLLLNAVCKNDLESVAYIINNSNMTLVNFNDVVFRQALFHGNKDILNLLLSLKRVNSDGMTDLLELTLNQDLKKFLQDSVAV